MDLRKAGNVMKTHRKCDLLLLLVIFFLFLPDAYGFEPKFICGIDFRDNKLSVNAENVPLESALLRISEKTGITFEVPSSYADRLISLNFQALPIEMALNKILSQYSFIKLFGRSGDIHNVIIISSKSRTGESNGEQPPITAPSTSSIKKDSEVERMNNSGFSGTSRGIIAGSERNVSLSNPGSITVGPPNNGKTAIVSEPTANENLETSGSSAGIDISSPIKGFPRVIATSGSSHGVQPRESSVPITQTGRIMSAKPANNEDMKISPTDGPMFIERPNGEEMKIIDSLNKMKIEP